MANKNPDSSGLKKFKSTWKSLPTKLIRVPEIFSDRVMQWARELDEGIGDNSAVTQISTQPKEALIDDYQNWTKEKIEEEGLKLFDRLESLREKEVTNLPDNRIETAKDYVRLYFEYDSDLVLRAKEIEDHHFNWDEKYWYYPLDKLEEVINEFPDFYVSPGIIKFLEEREERKEQQQIELQNKKKDHMSWLTNSVGNSVLSQPLKNGWELFDHQKVGVQWLLERVKPCGYNGAILADHMGLGKTITTLIAASLLQKKDGLTIVVICPASLKTVWVGAAKELGIEISVHSWAKFPVLKKGSKFVLICDEAHYAQSLKSARTKKMLNLAILKDCLACWLLTGTPLKNGRPINLFPLLQVCGHGFSKDLQYYRKYFCDLEQNRWGWDDSGAIHLDELYEGIQPILLRRKKEDCLDLPEKIRSLIPLKIEKTAKDVYKSKIEELRERHRERVRKGEIKSGGHILGELAILRHAGSMAKAQSAISFCTQLIEEGEKVVVFSEFKDTANLVSESLNGCLLTGDTPQKKRGKIIADFQAGKYPAFVGTIGAGGVGITLTEASYVILIDRPWTPGDAEQAEDRVHRIGQNSCVHAFWLQLPFGLDKDIDDLLNEKQRNIDKVLEGEANEDLISSQINSLGKEYLAGNKL